MSMRNDAAIGNDTGHMDTFEPGDTDWSLYLPPTDSWDRIKGLDLVCMARQALRASTAVQPEAAPPDPAQQAESWKQGLMSMGFFWEQDHPPAPKIQRKTTLRAPSPGPLDWPPGFAGEVASYIYSSAMRPVKEVAIVAALGLLAGICGRQWHIPGSGLNLYMVLVARSAVGKEAMHSGISSIVAACRAKEPNFRESVDFAEYASGPALIKALLPNPCFVNVSGELGRRFKRMAMEEGKDGPLGTLRTQMTNLYSKSAPTSVAGGLGYSNAANNVASISGAAYSLIGETTPGTFLESLTEGMMEDGFMSRFITVEYEGPRPDKNLSPQREVPERLLSAFLALMVQAKTLMDRDQHHLVERSPAAAAELELLEDDVWDPLINSTNDESRRQMWNRAHLKVLRIAALLAVADNYMKPVITLSHARWAINLVLRDTAAFTKRLDKGDVGSGDGARERKLVAIFMNYLVKPVAPSYKVPASMQENSIVPRNYLQTVTQKAAAFYNHKLGATRALDEAIQTCISNGYLMEVQKDRLVDSYSFHGRAYRIVRLPENDHSE